MLKIPELSKMDNTPLEQALEKVIAFFKERYNWACLKNINRDSGIEKNIGISGDDAVVFLNDYANIFGVDCSNFNFGTYFHAEGGIGLINGFLNLFRPPGKKVNNPAKELTIEHLAKGIVAGRLDDEIING
jgi:Protein of unknown function (DUF1493)